MQTKIEARNISLITPLVITDLVDAVLPAGLPSNVLISDTNSYDKIASSRLLRVAIEANQVVLVVNDYQLGKEESLQFLDKTKNVAKWRPVYIMDADSPYTASEGEFVIVDATLGYVQIFLPPALGVRGNDICITRIDDTAAGFAVEVYGDMGENIDIETSFSIQSQFEIVTVTSAVTEWFKKVSKKAPWDVFSILFADSPWTALAGQYIEADPTAGDIVILFPDATKCKGKEIKVKKLSASANKVTPTAFGGQLIEGVASIDMTTQNICYTFTSNGIGWSIT